MELSDFKQCCNAFRLRTGIGSDSLHPRVWALLSEPGASAILSFLKLVEGSAIWPEQASWLLYYLIPKDGADERPIGILATLMRVWERLRKPDMMSWMQQQNRSYDWAVAGRSSEAAVWEQQLHVEGLDMQLDDDTAIVSAAVLFDMVKCFKRVRRVVVVMLLEGAEAVAADHPCCIRVPAQGNC